MTEDRLMIVKRVRDAISEWRREKEHILALMKSDTCLQRIDFEEREYSVVEKSRNTSRPSHVRPYQQLPWASMGQV